jgi:hypothetical protein
MAKIVFISTIHQEIGKCNADELFRIIEEIGPEVIFLEATRDCYSDYDRYMNSQFGIYHKKSEIKAIQKYSEIFPIKYIPVLDINLPISFDEKINVLCRNPEYQRLIDISKLLVSEKGFEFLNSPEGDSIQEELREFEKNHFTDARINSAFDEGIDNYENTMIDNIFNFCNSNYFKKAVFMCGAAHRKSINQKVKRRLLDEGINLYWQNYGS